MKHFKKFPILRRKTALLSLVVILVFAPLAFLATRHPSGAKAAWFDNAWGFRQRMPLTNTSGAAQVDFQIMFTVDTASLVTAGKMQTSCADLRVTSNVGKLLPYWIEPTTCNTSTSKIWVKVDSLPTTNGEVFFYYGNPSAQAPPNNTPGNVFIRDMASAAVNWPLDDTTATQSYARVMNPAVATGRNIAINGTFDTDTIWTKGTGWTISGGVASSDGTQVAVSNLNQSGVAITGKTYQVTFTVKNYTSGNVKFCFSSCATPRSANGTFTESLAAGTTTLSMQASVGFVGSIDDVIVTQLTIPSSGSFSGSELITDGGMETWTDASNLTNWGKSLTGTDTLNREASVIHSGSFAARLDIDASNSIALLYHTGTVTAGKSYLVSFWARADVAGAVSLAVANGVAGQLANPIILSNVYTQYQNTVIATDAFIGFKRNTAPSHSIYIDDVSVKEINPLSGSMPITDSGGNASTLRPTLGSAAGGHLTNAFTFDGTNDNVNIYSSDLNSVFNPNEGTMVAWAKVSGAGVWTDATSRYIAHLTTADNNNEVSVFKSSTSNRLVIYSDFGGTVKQVNNDSFSPTGWQQYVLTWSKSSDQVKAYINGVQVGSTQTGLGTWSGNISSTATGIGAFNTSTGSFPWSGLINDVRLYTRALSSSEVSDMYGTSPDRQSYYTENYQSHELIRKYAATVTIGTPATEEAGSSPLADWKFDEGTGTTTSDSSGNGNLGSLTGTTWATEDQCVSSKCLAFDGSTSKVTATQRSPLNTLGSGDFTIETWIRIPLGTASNLAFVTKRTAGGSGLYFGSQSTTNVLIFGSAWGTTSHTFNVSIRDGRWHHLSVVHSGSNLLFYLDSVSVPAAGGGTNATPAINNTQNLLIGQDAQVSDKMKGYMDEVLIYPYARSSVQVQTDYNSRTRNGNSTGVSSQIGTQSNNALSSGLIGYWKMDEATWSGTLNEVVDSSGNGNHGTAQGATNGKAYPGGGKFGNGGILDGVDDFVSTNTPVSATDGTVAFWVKNPGGLYLFRSDANLRTYFTVSAGAITFTKGNPAVAITATPVVPANTWVHVALEWWTSGGVMYAQSFYNGSPLGTPKIFTGANVGTYATLGAFTNAGTQNASGSIDDVRVYNRALSTAEMTQLYNFAPGPLAYWKLDEGTGTTMADISGNGLNGVFGTGASAPTWALGKYGRALSIIPNEYAKVQLGGLVTRFNTGLTGRAFSYSMWFKPTNVASGTQQFLLTNNDSCNNFGHFSIYIVSGVVHYAYYSPGGSATVEQTFTPSPALQNNQWYHLEWTKTFGQLGVKAYLNGVSQTVSGDSVLLGYTSNLNNILFGALNGDGTTCTSGVDAGSPVTIRYFNGLLDDVKIYNYQRTQQQAVEDMNAAHPTGGSPIGSQLAWWKFDEGYGITANNSGNGGPALNGTLTAMSSPATATSGWQTATCKSGKCLTFDGIDDEVSVASPATGLDVGTSDFSLSLWIKPSNGSSAMRLIQKGNPFNASGTGYSMLYRGDLAGKTLSLQINDGSVTPCGIGSIGIGDISNTWTHVAVSVTRSTSTAVFYANGKQVGTPQVWAGCTGSFSKVAAFLIGGDSVWFAGQMDDVKVYASALTSDQVKIDYNEGLSLNFGVGTPATESAQLSDGPGAPPIAYWNFDEHGGITANDVSGNNLPGTLAGANGLPVWSPGKFNSALKFDGVDDVVRTASSMTFNTGTSAYTLSAWVKSDASITSANPSLLVVGSHNWPNIGFSMRSSGSSYCIKVWSTGFASCLGTISWGVWHHIEAVYTGFGSTARQLYVDGILIGSDSSGSTFNLSSTVDIGFNTYAGNTVPSPLIDDVKIYGYARTPAQVAYDFNRGAPSAWWKFDECQGGTLHDSANNNNVGTWAGGTAVGTCNTAATAWGNGVTGKFNSSLSFDGTDDYLSIPNSPSVTLTGDFTMSMWVNAVNWTNTGFIGLISKRDTFAGMDWELYLDKTNNEFRFIFRNSGGAPVFFNKGARPPAAGTWHQVLITRTGSLFSIYVDANLKATDVSALSMPSGTNSVRIGNLGGDSLASAFQGKIDDVRLYNYALSASQVKTLFDGGLAVQYAPASGSP